MCRGSKLSRGRRAGAAAGVVVAVIVSPLLSAGSALAGTVELLPGCERVGQHRDVAARAVQGSAVASADDAAAGVNAAEDDSNSREAFGLIGGYDAKGSSQRVVVEVQAPTPPVAAPLPPAVIPGALLIAGNWILVRVLKRKLV